jgi:hypothetical protein
MAILFIFLSFCLKQHQKNDHLLLPGVLPMVFEISIKIWGCLRKIFDGVLDTAESTLN